ncbi:hypothetical protein P280DRAFT_506381 [Massarina eburnea CBS 473.64]|uniref:Uncharacterized protein n=1 Tax=Massarina eburnea CBS 473.64 TaxID=1395130 RepID=A0A6A6S435_9PLEO|nr:hypothetical protein P280DRAFT_506381 [Massarina eburnea CBS 473.64]
MLQTAIFRFPVQGREVETLCLSETQGFEIMAATKLRCGWITFVAGIIVFTIPRSGVVIIATGTRAVKVLQVFEAGDRRIRELRAYGGEIQVQIKLHPIPPINIIFFFFNNIDTRIHRTKLITRLITNRPIRLVVTGLSATPAVLLRN